MESAYLLCEVVQGRRECLANGVGSVGEPLHDRVRTAFEDLVFAVNNEGVEGGLGWLSLCARFVAGIVTFWRATEPFPHSSIAVS